MGRSCGSCAVCCEVAAVPGLKPPHQRCPLQGDDPAGCCTVFGQPERPALCDAFQCLWLRGFGRDEDRPDLAGAMLTVNDLPDGTRFVFAGEVRRDAVLNGAARRMVVDVARKIDLPIVVVRADARPPDDTGDWVIVRDELLPRARRMAGPRVTRFAVDVSMYELVTERDG